MTLPPVRAAVLSAGATSSDDTATAFIPRLALSAAGELIEPLPDSKPISPADIEKAKPTPQTPAGLYNRASAERAINLLPDTQAMMAITALPNDVTLRSFATAPRQPLAPLLFSLAFLLFLGDTLAALFLGGGWHRLRGMATALFIFLVIPTTTPWLRPLMIMPRRPPRKPAWPMSAPAMAPWTPSAKKG